MSGAGRISGGRGEPLEKLGGEIRADVVLEALARARLRFRLVVELREQREVQQEEIVASHR